MTWASTLCSIVEDRPAFGGAHVIGRVLRRECGCSAYQGVRLDKGETTFGVSSCSEHAEQVKRALFVFGHMEPCDREVFELYAELLDRESADAQVPA